MSAYAGFDTTWPYPGEDVMRFLMLETNLFWVGYYLPVADRTDPRRLSDRLTWKGSLPSLVAQGWGVAPIYVGKQHDTTVIPGLAKLREPSRSDRLREEGARDGAEACQLAIEAGFPRGTVIYFDVERPWEATKHKVSIAARRGGFLTYFQAWCDALNVSGYWPGVYCSHLIAAEFPSVFVWVVQWKFFTTHKDLTQMKPALFPTDEPCSSKCSQASTWQLAHKCFINFQMMNASGTVYGTPRPMEIDLNSSIYKDPGYPIGNSRR